jgi:predicted protein tyrosine phosphatase
MSEKMPETQRAQIVQNPYQGDFKRVLCICTGGILRSPTAAWVLSNQPYNFNTRSAGIREFALVKVDDHLIGWADQIVCMEDVHADYIRQTWNRSEHYPKSDLPEVLVLGIPDDYEYRDPALVARIRRSYEKETR